MSPALHLMGFPGPLPLHNNQHAGTATWSAAYVLVTIASCVAHTATSLPTTSWHCKKKKKEFAWVQLLFNNANSLSSSPRTGYIAEKSACLSIFNVSRSAWITCVESGHECQYLCTFLCIWMRVNGFWCRCVYLCPCQKGLSDVQLEPGKTSCPPCAQIRLQSSRQHQTMQQQPECPGPHLQPHGSWRLLYCKFHSLLTHSLTTWTQTLVSTSIHIHIHAEFIFKLWLCSVNLTEKRQQAPEG